MTTKHKQGFGRPPRKGTKLRKCLIMMLRPQGILASEIYEIYEIGSYTNIINSLINEKGYDIRIMPSNVKSALQTNRTLMTYKCVGKMRWDGSYRSFNSRSLEDELP